MRVVTEDDLVKTNVWQKILKWWVKAWSTGIYNISLPKQCHRQQFALLYKHRWNESKDRFGFAVMGWLTAKLFNI